MQNAKGEKEKTMHQHYCKGCGKPLSKKYDFCLECQAEMANAEKESQSSQHCDSGYMNDTRFGSED
jgi:hypothetical protein